MSAQLPAELDPPAGGPADAVVIEGFVEHGDERGRQLGFPTANLHDVSVVRLDGVYAATFQIDPARSGPTYVAAVSVGRRPTYYGRDGFGCSKRTSLTSRAIFTGGGSGSSCGYACARSTASPTPRRWCASCAWTWRRREPGR